MPCVVGYTKPISNGEKFQMCLVFSYPICIVVCLFLEIAILTPRHRVAISFVKINFLDAKAFVGTSYGVISACAHFLYPTEL